MAGFVLVGIDTAGGPVTYWKGSGALPCMVGPPTLGSIYAGDGSLLSSMRLPNQLEGTAIIPHWRQAGLVYLKQGVLHWY